MFSLHISVPHFYWVLATIPAGHHFAVGMRPLSRFRDGCRLAAAAQFLADLKHGPGTMTSFVRPNDVGTT
jgi:hypothetical protein